LTKNTESQVNKRAPAGRRLKISGVDEVELPPRCHASVVTGSFTWYGPSVCHCPICHSTLFSEPSRRKEKKMKKREGREGKRIYRNWSQSTKF
jgi:hypothetical protein